MRALFVFVVLCLVSAARPTPSPIYDDPTEARLDVAKSSVELAAPRREGRAHDPRAQRDLAPGVPVRSFAVVAPRRTALLVETVAPAHTAVPVVFARSSRGPPALGSSS